MGMGHLSTLPTPGPVTAVSLATSVAFCNGFWLLLRVAKKERCVGLAVSRLHFPRFP